MCSGERGLNLLASGCGGCHIAQDPHTGQPAPWVLGQASLPASAKLPRALRRDEDALVQLELTDRLSVLNFDRAHARVVYISVTSDGPRIELAGADGALLAVGSWLPEGPEGPAVPCVTFVVVLRRRGVVHLARPVDAEELDLYKLDFRHCRHPNPDMPPQLSFGHFPLGPPERGPWLCTQGFGGALTHFFPESYHAIDFRCAAGTPILAVLDGTITEVRDHETVSGIHCDNLSHWNSLALTAGRFVIEYVHIQPGSASVKRGEAVVAGQQLCLAGQVGFAPEPHVHIEVHTTDDLRGPSVAFDILGDPAAFVPVAGRSYSYSGPIG